jgi:hypothetical protein
MLRAPCANAARLRLARQFGAEYATSLGSADWRSGGQYAYHCGHGDEIQLTSSRNCSGCGHPLS